MGCFSDREKGPPEETAKWDFITLSDFRCTSAWTVAAYIWLWFLAIVGVAVYVVDTYTAVNLLAFNHWSSKVQPKLDFKYSKWIFAGCILLSWTLCLYEWIRALRVIRRGGVAESFLDPLAVSVQSMRKKGWKRFLVFTELTKSKKGADYVALFVYFSFKTAIRVILAEGPRQAVNALTLYAVMEAQLIPNQPTDRSNFDQFWYNVQTVADDDKQQAVVYFSMLFTLVIWVFSALSLMVSGVLYIFFLWHYIPQRDGRLSIYCRRKVDKRLAKVVEYKVKAAIEQEQRKEEKAERKAEQQRQRQKTGEQNLPMQGALKKQPTLPDIGGTTPEIGKDDKLPDFPLVRHDTNATMSTLPLYSTRPSISDDQRQPTLPTINTGGRPGMPMRSATQSSGWSAAPSYATDAPLLANAGYAGSPEDIPLPSSAITRQTSYSSFQPSHGRTESQSTQGSRRPFTPGIGPRSQTPMSARPYTPGGYGPPLSRASPAPRLPLPARSNTAFSFDRDHRPATSDEPVQDDYEHSFSAPKRANTAEGSFSNFHGSKSFSRPGLGRNGSQPTTYRAYAPTASTVLESERSASPENIEMQPRPSHTLTTTDQSSGTYAAFNPSMHSRPTMPTKPASFDNHREDGTVNNPPRTDNRDSSAHLDVPQSSLTVPAVKDVRSSNYAHDILDEYGPSDDEDINKAPLHTPASGPERSASVTPHVQY